MFIGQDNGVDSYFVQDIIDIAGPIVDQQNALHVTMVVVMMGLVMATVAAMRKCTPVKR